MRQLPDDYEETRRRLNIISLLDSSGDQPGDPLLVRQSRKIDRLIKRNEALTGVLKKSLRPAKDARNLSRRAKKLITNRRAAEHVMTYPATIELPAPTNTPDVSIVIPVFNKIDTTLNCLRSFHVLKTSFTYEIVIVDNASSDSTHDSLSSIENLVYVRNDDNLGFVEGCNTGVAHSRGHTLVFLNNDTEVTENWLDWLVKPLDEDGIGLVGSKLLYPDNSLQEAGGIIFDDGTGTNYGKHQAADYFTFNYRREVDYCSGASIAIKTDLFKQLNAFDVRFAPAYYEDTDLAFQVREAGLKVIYEPRSVAYHIEGKTAGTDLNSGFKKYQTINHVKFLKKWKKTLTESHHPSHQWYQGRDRAGDKLALIIDDKIPSPDKDSGSQRMVRLIEDLQSLGYKVTFWPMNLKYEKKYAEALQAKGVEVVYGDVSFVHFAQQFGRYYDLVILSRPYVAASYLEACRAWFYKARLVYDTVDLHFLRTARQAEAEPANYEGLMDQSRGYESLEIGIGRRTDATLVVSEAEKQIINKIDPTVSVSVVSNIHKIVPMAYKSGFENRKDLLFIGGFDHLPNQDAVKWFANEIFPLIRKKDPTIRFKVVGANMDPALAKTLSGIEGIDVLGYLEDITQLFIKTRVFVSPLRFGAGVKGKIGQAIEYGIPVVSTDIGVEGMHLRDGVSCYVANDAATFARKVTGLYEGQKEWAEVQSAARKILERYFSHAAAQKGLREAID